MKVYCGYCNIKTNHNKLYEKENSGWDEYHEIYASTKYQVVQCKGCDTISFRVESICSEDIDPNTGEIVVYETLYPEAKEDMLVVKDYFMPIKIYKIYREVINTYNSDNNTLCAAGIRALIEGICAEQQINNKSLQSKITELVSKGIITEAHSDALHTLRFIGNKALHELDVPTKPELKLAIEIMEHTLENIYDLPQKSEELKHRVKK